MTIYIRNAVAIFVILLNNFEFNNATHHITLEIEIIPDTNPPVAVVPLELFHVEDTTLAKSKGRTSNRAFNTDFVQTTADTKYIKFFQYDVKNTDLQFMFEKDAYRRLVDVYKLDGNERPATKRKHLTTHVATLNHVEFLVHKNIRNVIVGASAPPNQIPKPVAANNIPRPRPAPEGHRDKRQKIAPSL